MLPQKINSDNYNNKFTAASCSACTKFIGELTIGRIQLRQPANPAKWLPYNKINYLATLHEKMY